MTRLAIAGNPRFILDDREVRTSSPSYTVNTLASLRKEIGNASPIWLMMGADAFLGLPAWKEWQRLFELANIAVAHRPGYRLAQSDLLSDQLAHELQKRRRDTPCSTSAGSIYLKPVTALDISATAIRNSLSSGASVRYLLPDNVLDYIQQNRLYTAA